MHRFPFIKYRLILVFVNLFRFFSFRSNSRLKNNFFILGSGRNGSTLLASILNAHHNLFIPPEQFVLPYVIMKRYLCFQTINNWKNDVINMLVKDKKTLNWDVNLDNIELDRKDVFSLFNLIYLRYARKYKKEIAMWGDKTPLNIHFSHFIYPEFKSSKYIFLIRDPRDVALSYKKLLSHKAVNTNYAIWKWKDSIRNLKYLQKQTDVLIVHYEKLVELPNQEINRVLRYLGFPEDDNLIYSKTNASYMGVGEKDHHQNLNTPISAKSVGKWKDKLSKKDINLIHKECYDYLKEFGYSI